MNTINLNIEKVKSFVSAEKIFSKSVEAFEANKALEKGTGKGNDFLGWVNLPSSITSEMVEDIKNTAKNLRAKCDIIVVAGIGGSYLGTKAVVDALSNSFEWLQTDRKNPVILYAGNNISEDYLSELSEYLEGKSFGIINISKSGTTTETALAFRILKTLLEKQVGKEEAGTRIVAITDASKGALRKLSTLENYKTFVIPDNVGGRYSVLTPVGLLPIAVAGFDIDKLIEGAIEMEKNCHSDVPVEKNPAAIYALTRNELYQSGKKIEIMVNYHPKLHFFSEWWKQLYGESEGKENKGIYPSSVDFTTDLHSMGQWIQEGERIIFETVISIANANREMSIPVDEDDLDGLNYLKGKRVDQVNKMAEL